MAALADEDFKKRATAAGFSIAPLGSADASAFLQKMDEDMYPVLLEAGLVKVRQK